MLVVDKPINIVLIDDHDLFREGLCSLLTQNPNIRAAGTASNGPDGITLCHSVQPDVVLLDISMPQFSGLDTLEQLI